MRVFLAGASGAIGRRLMPLLVQQGHMVTGTTRSPARARDIERAGVTPAVLDVFDAQATNKAIAAVNPDVIIHQLTDLPREADSQKIAAHAAGNARIRSEGTRNLIAAARAASVRRFIVQSIAFDYAPASAPHRETDPLNLSDPARSITVRAVADMEGQVLGAPGIAGIVLRYGRLYGPGTWSPDGPASKPALHVDAAAHAAMLATTNGEPGIYNIADDDGVVSITKARTRLGFDPGFRLR
jgi:nucleoside-diphosphate-sugar epimerase